ncbi:DUF1416 domain-containing protein [Stackebrandtia soli]|uniref:DUF1416 domain-containing protein n=1 Tax=Stackebrandtia soli TaxID=1892856 RepID=UPI0039E821D1
MTANVTTTAAGCGAPAQTGSLPASVDLATETVVSGRVLDAAERPVEGAYVRLLDASGEFTAEVVTADGGVFRFFAAPGDWTLRALSRSGEATVSVGASVGLNDVTVSVSR